MSHLKFIINNIKQESLIQQCSCNKPNKASQAHWETISIFSTYYPEWKGYMSNRN